LGNFEQITKPVYAIQACVFSPSNARKRSALLCLFLNDLNLCLKGSDLLPINNKELIALRSQTWIQFKDAQKTKRMGKRRLGEILY
jgi:hypothetical protein